MPSSMRIGSVAYKLLKLFAHKGGMPGYTTGELIIRAGLHPGTAAHQRMTLDMVGKGWKVLKDKDKVGVQRYWMAGPERERAKTYLRELHAQKRAVEFAKERKKAA